MTVDYERAHFLARQHVDAVSEQAGTECMVIDDMTAAIPEGWVFFYNSAEYLRTGDLIAALAGNGPLFVRTSGQVHILPTYSSWEEGVKSVLQWNGSGEETL